MVPVVAARTDPNTGYNVFVHGGEPVVGGTSAVAPLFAGLLASFGTQLGFVTPKLWEIQKAFNVRSAASARPACGLKSSLQLHTDPRDAFTKSAEEQLLLRHVTPLSRRDVVYFCSDTCIYLP